jgi:hypothetical protein
MLATLLIALALLPQSINQKTPATIEPLTLTGCVSPKPDGGSYTFTDGDGGNQYRLTGKDIRKYAGQKVEVVAEKRKRFEVKGGLYPSPNVAGQAGALDPVESAIATQRGSGVKSGSAADLPEFRAGQVRAVTGACQ